MDEDEEVIEALEDLGNETAPAPTPEEQKGIVIPVDASYDEVVFNDPLLISNPSPVDKWGMKFVVGAVAVVVVFAVLLVCFIMHVTKWVEQRQRAQKRKEDDSKGKKLAKALKLYRWYLEDTENPGDTASSSSSSSGSSASPDSNETKEEMEEPHLSNKWGPEKVNYSIKCGICSVDFTDGSIVYESNNPKCRHIFHKCCIDKWLNYQFTCPVCNEVYALQTI